MAPFKFGKRSSKDKNKQSKDGSNNSPKGSPSRFLHLGNNNSNNNSNNNNNNNQSNNTGNLFGRNENGNANRNVSYTSTTSNNSVQNNSNNSAMFNGNSAPQQKLSPVQQAPQFAKYDQSNNPRLFPTPIPEQQRNVSGATSIPLVYDNSNKLQPQLPSEKTVWNRVKLANSPFPRYRHVSSAYASDDDKVYVIGGLHDQSVYGDTWIIKSENNATKFTSHTVDIGENTPPPRVGHASTLCGNAFVIFGGDTHKVNQDGLMDDDIYLFNINSFKWTIPHPVGPRPLGRYGHKISVIATSQMKTKLYLFGGQFDETYFNDLSVFDLSSFRRADSHWEFLKPKTFTPPPLTNHTMVSYAHKLWVFGGDTQQGLLNKIFVYDPIANDWSIVEPRNIGAELKDIPPSMQEHAALVYKDLMVIVGGKDEQDIYLNTVYFFNFKSCKWFKLPVFSLGIPQGRSGHSVSLLKNNKLLIMGGDKFDYAAIDDNDLHTSDINMGKGTILYTLDLTRLEEMCPGIMDDVSTPLTGDTPTYNNVFNEVKKHSEHPISRQSSANGANNNIANNATTNGSPGYNTTPTTFSAPANPVQIQNNILTPYSDPEHQNTPKAENTDIFPIVKQTNTIPSEELKSPITLDQITKNPLDENIVNSEEPMVQKTPVMQTRSSIERTPATDNSFKTVSSSIPNENEAVKSPITEQKDMSNKIVDDLNKEAVIDNIVAEETIPIASPSHESKNQEHVKEEKKDKSQLSEPDKDEFKDSQNIESQQLDKLNAVEMSPDLNKPESDNESITNETFENNTLDDLIPSPQPELMHSDNEEDILEDPEEISTEPLNTDVDNIQVNKSISVADSNMTTIDKKVLENFRSELQNLRDIANEKSLEASNHIRDLENQIIRLKGINKKSNSLTADNVSATRLQNQYDILVGDNNIMRDRILELEGLLSDKFLDLGNLNDIIKQQKVVIDNYDENNLNEDEIEELKLKVKVLTEENKTLKNDIKVRDTTLTKNINVYSEKIDSLVTSWQSSSNSNSQEDNETDNHDGKDSKDVSSGSYHPHHKHVVNKLSNQLDDLLIRSQGLSESRDKLNEDYHELETKHQSTNEDLSATKEELQAVKKNYEETLKSINNTGKALDISEKELEKYKSLNKKLQEEMDNLKLHNIDSPQLKDGSFSPDDDKTGSINDAHFNMKLNDLRAELFIVKQERDSMKDEMLELKKKLYSMDSN